MFNVVARCWNSTASVDRHYLCIALWYSFANVVLHVTVWHYSKERIWSTFWINAPQWNRL